MGTSGAYTGSGSKDARMFRDAVSAYLASLPGRGALSGAHGRPGSAPPSLSLQTARLVLRLLRGHEQQRQSGERSAGERDNGRKKRKEPERREEPSLGPVRRISDLARVAGLAAAAAYAYRRGDAHTLRRLRLDYRELQGTGDDLEVLRRIVGMACGEPDSTIEDHERRLVAADVGEWVLGQDWCGPGPVLADIARYAITVIVATVLLTECGHVLNAHPLADLGEAGIWDTAAALAARAPLRVRSASEEELILAIDGGLEFLVGAFAEAG